MHYEMFVQEFRERTGLISNLEAIDAAKAILVTLFECLPGVLTREVELHLPCALRSDSRIAEWTPGERLMPSEFLLRVARRTGTSESVAFCHAQAILQMLGACLGFDLQERVRAALPTEFEEFWGADPARSHMHQPVA